MPHLWVQDERKEWAVLPLVDKAYCLSSRTPRRLDGGSRPEPGIDQVVLVAGPGQPGERWVLLAGKKRRTWLNGLPLTLGLRVLRDRDEIRIEGTGTLFFSTENLARVETFAGEKYPVYCPRCRREIVKGTSAVRCPRCGLRFHQSDQFPCWTYGPSCPNCSQPTDLEAWYSFTPEDL